MKAVIVAAGRGKRLMPLTAEVPKPLLHIHETPLIEYLLRGLRWAGVLDVALVVGYLGEQIEQAYGDGSALGIRIAYAWQSETAGTGSAFLAAEELAGDEPFMLLWGDILMEPENYRRIRRVYAEKPCDLLSALNWLDDPSTGAAVYVGEDRIIRIEEKPSPGAAQTHWNQAGLFVCTKDVFTAVRECGLSPRGEIEFTAGVQRLIDKGRDVRWMPLEGFWSDVGTLELLAFLNSQASVPDLLR